MNTYTVRVSFRGVNGIEFVAEARVNAPSIIDAVSYAVTAIETKVNDLQVLSVFKWEA